MTERPRVCHVPPYKTSAGDDAIDLAASAGVFLDDWQRYVLRESLGEREDGRWSSFEIGLIVARQQGKGEVLLARELAGLVLFDDRLVMHTAHELKTSMEHFQRLEQLFENSDSLRRKVKRITRSNGKEGLEMMNGCRLHCLARSKGSGRGFSGDLVVLDEAYALTPTHMDATMPTTLARNNAQVWYTSSPPLDAVSGEVLMALRDRGESGESGRLAWFDYGLEGSLDHLERIDLDDEDLWHQALPALRAGRVRLENVRVLRDALSDQGFAREVLGLWPPGLGKSFQVIPAEDWAEAEDENSEIEGPYVLCVAVSVDRSRSCIVACGAREDGREHVEVTSTALRTDNRNGTAWVAERVATICRRHPPLAVVMDSFGPTGSLIADVNRSLHDTGVELDVIPLNMADVSRAYGMFYDRVSGTDRAGRTLRHIGQPELTTAVAGAKRRTLGDGYAWDRRAATVDITPLVAATGALYGWNTRPEDDPAFTIF